MPAPKRVSRLSNQECARAMVANVRWAERLGWSSFGDALALFLDAEPWQGPGGAALAQAVARYQRAEGLGVDGIIGKDTWGRLRPALAPPGSITGLVPPDAPLVPNGFDEVIALYGDPRPLLHDDGKIGTQAEALWQRRTLARGTLPFPIPLDPRRPAQAKRTFYAHRKLVSTFEAVFAEIARLGLRNKIRSWGGIYNFRPIRGGNSLSLHAFGAAVDLNAETNPLGAEDGDMSEDVIEIFTHFGFLWGGNFGTRPDPMHFQYATGY